MCASLLNITPEIVDRFFDAYQTNLPRKVDFVNDVERRKIRCALADDKPETTLHSINRDLYPAIYIIICILLTMTMSSATKDFSVQLDA